MSDINETLKQKLDELDLDRRVNEFVGQSEDWVRQALGAVAAYAHEHRDDADRTLDRIVARIDEDTDGKYAEQLGKVREKVELGLTKLAERRPEDASPAGTSPAGTSPAGTGTASAEDRVPDDLIPDDRPDVEA